jgi:hypothetical protein
MTVTDKKMINGFEVEIWQDPDCSSPMDDWVPGCHLALTHRRYDLHDDTGYAGSYDDLAELEDAIRRDFGPGTDAGGVLYVTPVYGYDHSTLSLSAARQRGYPYSDPWDSGIAGLAYVTRHDWEETQGKGTRYSPHSSRDRGQAQRLIEGVVDVYSQWLGGETYGYTVTDPRDGETVAQCGGYIGFEVAEEAAAEEVPAGLDVKCSGRLNTRSGRIEHASFPCPLHGEAVMS